MEHGCFPGFSNLVSRNSFQHASTSSQQHPPTVVSKANCAVIQHASPEEVPEVRALSTLHLANPLPKGDVLGY